MTAAAVTWSTAHEARLVRTRDEACMAALWRQLAPGAPPLPSRAACLLSLLCELPGGAAAVEAARRGDARGVLALVSAPALHGLRPELVHVLAILFERLAEHHARIGAHASAVDARVRSLAAWVSLAGERAYLERLVMAVLGPDVVPAERSQALDQACLEPLARLGAEARAGARERTATAAIAIAVLADVSRATRMAGADTALARRLAGRALALHASAVDEVAAPILERLRDQSARGEAADEAIRTAADLARAWRFAGEDEALERLALDELIPIAWELHRAERWDDLRAAVDQVAPLVERLARRIQSDPAKLAYAAPCAQMLVFRGEHAATLPERRALCERALALCPTHRNARVVLATALADEVLATLGKPTWQTSAAELALAERTLERGAQLWPGHKRVAHARERLAARRGGRL